MKAIYLAAPLFSEAEREYNKKLRDAVRKLGFSVFLPQEDSNNLGVHGRQRQIYEKNLKAIDASDIIIAVLDGSDIDSGTAWEVGYACARNKKVIGLRTDFRTLGAEGRVNLMIENSLHSLCNSTHELLGELEKIRVGSENPSAEREAP